MDIQAIHDLLGKNGYYSNKKIEMALYIALAQNKPLLVEGAPGVGKTALAKALAKALKCDFVRAQMYEGLTKDSLVYDYNYQKQLLTIELVRPALGKAMRDKDMKSALELADSELSNFYGEGYLVQGPVLKALKNENRTVLLIDEIDKAPEEIEYMLFEFLEDYSISIPELGNISCNEDKKPIVFITSNGYRKLSMPLKRRCAYLYMENKTYEEYVEILKTKARVDERLATGIARCLVEFSEYNLKISQIPSVAEGIEWAKFLNENKGRTKEYVLDSLPLIVKEQRDEEIISDIVAKENSLWK